MSLTVSNHEIPHTVPLQIVAMRLQHEQILQNLRSSNMVEIRRALHNQSVDLIRQHQTQAEYAANGQAIAARDKALEELQELQVLHSELQIKVRLCCRLCSMSSVSVLGGCCNVHSTVVAGFHIFLAHPMCLYCSDSEALPLHSSNNY